MKKLMLVVVILVAVTLSGCGSYKRMETYKSAKPEEEWLHEEIITEEILHEEWLHEEIITEFDDNVTTWDDIQVNEWP